MITVNDLQEKVNKANGSRKSRILHPDDVEKFIYLVNNAGPEVQSIRVYSSEGFVPNSYKYQISISYLQANRNPETGEFQIGASTTDAKRSHGQGALITVNGR